MKTLALAMFATFALLAACATSKPSEDSKSHWLRACSAASECGGSLSCTCGVCTQSCEDTASCVVGGVDFVACANPGKSELASACGVESGASEQRVCLQGCDRSADCGDEQRCVHGACVGMAAMRDAGGTPVSAPQPTGDAATHPLVGRDSGVVGDLPAIDPERFPDAGMGDAGTLLCSSELRECCAWNYSCEQGLLCHIDDSCIAPGTADERGVAPLDTPLSQGEMPLAADDAFLYGVNQRGSHNDDLVRWPVEGGAPRVLASGLGFVASGYGPPLILDGDVLYFTAAATAVDISDSLLRMPTDGSSPPEPSGTAGTWLAQNATHLYFTNDGDSRVLRLPKASFGTASAREEIYASTLGTPSSIMSIALNSTTLFVAELNKTDVNTNSYVIHAIDTTSLAATVLTTFERDAAPWFLPVLFASDRFLVVRDGIEWGGGPIDRIDLQSHEVKALPYGGGCALNGDHLIATSRESEKWLVDIDLTKSEATHILPVPEAFNNPLVVGNLLYGVDLRWLSGGHSKFVLLRIQR